MCCLGICGSFLGTGRVMETDLFSTRVNRCLPWFFTFFIGVALSISGLDCCGLVGGILLVLLTCLYKRRNITSTPAVRVAIAATQESLRPAAALVSLGASDISVFVGSNRPPLPEVEGAASLSRPPGCFESVPLTPGYLGTQPCVSGGGPSERYEICSSTGHPWRHI